MFKITSTIMAVTILSCIASVSYADENIIIAEEHMAGHLAKEKLKLEAAEAAVEEAARTPDVIATEKYAVKLNAIPPVKVNTAQAGLLDNSGAVIGEASFWQGTNGVIVKLYVEGLTPGLHGVHIHQDGKCEMATNFKSAKGHIMHKTEKSHGFLHHEGPHSGDLPNIIVNKDGVGHAEFYSERFRLHYEKAFEEQLVLMDDSGASIMIHAAADDYISQPIGGSGKRVACGVLRTR